MEPGPARRNPTNIVSAACGKFHAVILQEASDHVRHFSEQLLVCRETVVLAERDRVSGDHPGEEDWANFGGARGAISEI